MGTKKHKSDRERRGGGEQKSRDRGERDHRGSKRRRRSRSRSNSTPSPSRSQSPVESRPVRRNNKQSEVTVAAPLAPPATTSSAGDSSLSISETNKIRAQLGLKPLETSDSNPAAAGEQPTGQPKADVHVPAKNIGAELAAEAVRMRIETVKSHRRMANKLSRVRTLGEESDNEESDKALHWIQRSRKLEEEKKLALQRAKTLAEMDDEFGVSETIKGENERERNQSYTSRHLRGLNVEHSLARFKEGRDVVLVVKDRGVLDAAADEPDTLVNPNLIDEEQAEKNVLLRSRGANYKAYADDEWDEMGNYKPHDMLDKYSEIIDGEKKSSFKLESGGKYYASQESEAAPRERLDQQRADYPELRVASEFFTEQEMEEKFKKRKRKVRVMRKKLRADDLLPDAPLSTSTTRSESTLDVQLPYKSSVALSGGSELDAAEEDDLVGPSDDLTGMPLEPDDASEELQQALTKALKSKSGIRRNPQQAAAELLRNSKLNEDESNRPMSEAGGIIITLNRTAEFCRSLGDIPTYGQSGNRDEQEADELAEFEAQLQSERRQREELSAAAGGWQEVGGSSSKRLLDGSDSNDTTGLIGASAILEDEPVLNKGGVAAALAMASRKGYLEQKSSREPDAQIVNALRAKHFVQEDIRYDDIDSKFNKRDRYSGPLSDFREKAGYRPEVNLEYVDHCGRDISAKEAFRDLSHRFHGKYSGKKKTEKREKRIKEGILMRTMSSSDTPLGTADKLHRKLERQGQAYVVLSGKGRDGSVL